MHRTRRMSPPSRSSGAAVTAVVISLAAAGLVTWLAWQRRADEAAAKASEDNKRFQQTMFNASMDERLRRSDLITESAKEAEKSGDLGLASFLRGNADRVRSGQKPLCTTCLGRGITKDRGGPAICSMCNGSKEERY